MRLAKRLALPLITVNRARPAFKQATEVCIGFVPPMAIGAAMGQTTWGLVAGMSGMLVVMGDPGGAFQRRARLAPAGMLLGSVVLLVMLLLAAYPLLSVLLTGVFIFASGIFMLFGAQAGSIASPMQLMVLLGLALPPGDAANSLLLFALSVGGVVWGTIVVLATWPLRGGRPGWETIASAFDATADLADGASHVVRADPTDTDSEHLSSWDECRFNLGPIYAQATDNQQYVELDGQPGLEVMRHLDKAASAIMALATRLISRDGLSDSSRMAVADDLAEIGSLLRVDAHDIGEGGLPRSVEVSVPTLRSLAASDPDQVLARLAQGVVATVASLQALGSQPESTQNKVQVRAPLIDTVRAGFSRDSPVFRHILRFSVTSMIAVGIYRLFDVPDGAWIFLTVMVVLRPGIGSTIDRLLQRSVGTMFGVVLAAALVWLLTGHVALIVAAMTVLLFLMISLAPLNYLFWAIAITPFVLLGIDTSSPDDYSDVWWRLLNTLIGAALCLFATYALWPSRGASLVPRALAQGYQTVSATINALVRDNGTESAHALHLRSRAVEANVRMLNADLETEPGVSPAILEQERILLWALVRVRTHVLTAIIELEQRGNRELSSPEAESAAQAAEDVDELDRLARLVSDGQPHRSKFSVSPPQLLDQSTDSVRAEFVGVQNVAESVALRLKQLDGKTK